MLDNSMFYPNYTLYMDYGNGTIFPQKTQPKGGWICPNCKRGVAPWNPYCDCSFSGRFPVQYG